MERKMASAQKRARSVTVDYKQLNSFSSVVLHDNAPRQKRSKFYEVERIITRRRTRYDYEYLIKWRGWSLDSSSFEPSSNLTADLLRNYDNPPITDDRLRQQCVNFCVGITSALKSPRSSPAYISLDLDVWRFATNGKGEASEHRGNVLFGKDDLARLKYLPNDWWYYLNQDGQGVAVDFPLKAKPLLSWSPQKFINNNGKLDKAKRFPIEKVCITIVRRACSINSVL